MHSHHQSVPEPTPQPYAPGAFAANASTTGKRKKILLLYGGPNDRDVSLYNLLTNAGFACVNYDLKNGQTFDLADDVVWDQVLYDIAAWEYISAFASPDCSTFCNETANYTCDESGEKVCKGNYFPEQKCDPQPGSYTCDQTTGEKICEEERRTGEDCDKCIEYYYGEGCKVYLHVLFRIVKLKS